MQKIDLATLDTKKGGEEGFELELLHPVEGYGLGQFITVIGADSESYQEQLRALQQKTVSRMFKKSRLMNAREEGDNDAIELLVTATRSWRDIELDGQPLAFSADAARKLYRRFEWVREQVAGAIQDRANFLPRSAGAS